MKKLRRVKKVKRVLKKAKRTSRIKKITRKKTVQFSQTQTAKASEPVKTSIPVNVSAPVRQEDLPVKYDRDKMVLQVRDPRWLHTYWEIREDTLTKFKNELKDEFYKARRILRVYDVSHIIFDGNNAHRFFDLQINEYADNWYIEVGGPGRSWCVDYGLLLSDGRFITILRSNTVETPLEGPSCITDEEWMIPDDMFARLYGIGFGLGSSPVGKGWPPFVSSVSSPIKKAPRKKA